MIRAFTDCLAAVSTYPAGRHVTWRDVVQPTDVNGVSTHASGSRGGDKRRDTIRARADWAQLAMPDAKKPRRESLPAHSTHDAPADSPAHPGGSGTAGQTTPEKEQAGSYARDAEQDPERERHGRADADQ